MSSMQALAGETPVPVNQRRPPWRGRRHGSEFRWAIAFVLPYAAVFFAFVVYPFGYALWMASKPSLYAELFADPLYLPTVVNTAAVRRPRREREDVPGVVAVRFLPAPPLVDQGFAGRLYPALADRGGTSLRLVPLDADRPARLGRRLLSALFGIDGPNWFGHRWLALGSNIVAYIWKWMPFWTVIFLAGRMTIPRDIYDAAEVDGATGIRRFVHVTFPLLANLYLICTLLSTLWTLGDFTTVYLVSGGAPALSTEVLATLGFRYAFDTAKPALGVAAVMSALPVLIPIVILLMRRLRTSEVQL